MGDSEGLGLEVGPAPLLLRGPGAAVSKDAGVNYFANLYARCTAEQCHKVEN